MSAARHQPKADSVPEARILVVDDEPNIVELLSVSLRFQGFELHTASSGPAALDRAREVHPDAVILDDVMMPDMDGFGVLRRMRADVAVRRHRARRGQHQRGVEGRRAGLVVAQRVHALLR